MAENEPGTPAPQTVDREMTAAERKILHDSFAGKLCPMSFSAQRQTEQSRLITPTPGAPPPQSEALGCQGPGCMWFRILQDAKGEVIGGECAIALLSLSISQVPMQLGGVLAQLGKFRFTPRGE